MTWRVRLAVLPLEGMRSPEGETAAAALAALGFGPPSGMTVGKLYEWTAEGDDAEVVRRQAMAMAEALLANPVSERAEVVDVREVRGAPA